MNARQEKGYQIAQQKQVKETKNGWLVKAQSKEGFYRVSEDFICDCPDSELHDQTCKHAYAVRYYLDIEKRKPEGIQSEKIRLTYAQAWRIYNEVQTHEGTLFDELLRDLCFTIKTNQEPQLKGKTSPSIRRPDIRSRKEDLLHDVKQTCDLSIQDSRAKRADNTHSAV